MSEGRLLADILAEVSGVVEVIGSAGELRGIAYDSRQVQPGDLFVALPGDRTDGHRYVATALAAGAVGAVVAERVRPITDGLPAGRAMVVVRDTRRALADLACAFHGHASRRLRLIGVTGTDGKTTTTHMIAHLLGCAGRQVGCLSTVAVQIGDSSQKNTTNHTTPQAPEIQSLLAQMVKSGVTDAVLEVSSHALALERVTGAAFDVAVFTNLTSEHLDFHETLDEYRAAKARLFAMLGEGPERGPRYGIVNADDPSAEALAAACPASVWRYSMRDHADIVARDVQLTASGTRFEAVTHLGSIIAETRLRGRYNVANWLGAIGAALALGVPPQVIARAIPEFVGVPGRWQYVEAGQPFAVVIDFAHTPNALANVLQELRWVTPGRVIVVFGHPGGRDRTNRPALAVAAARNADFAIVTTDDPYDEDPAAIIAEIEPGFAASGRRAGSDYASIVDRHDAIATALRLAREGDTVLIAGRGHEHYTNVRGQYIAFDDVAVTYELLGGRGDRPADVA